MGAPTGAAAATGGAATGASAAAAVYVNVRSWPLLKQQGPPALDEEMIARIQDELVAHVKAALNTGNAFSSALSAHTHAHAHCHAHTRHMRRTHSRSLAL